jgi:DNA-directed RNA polymerase subunit RPC12/RpoP
MSKRRRPSRVIGTRNLTRLPDDLRGTLAGFGLTCPTCGDAEAKDFLTLPDRRPFLVRCEGCGHRLLYFESGQA